MTEPISKKSGSHNRRSKARKLEDLQNVLDKTRKIQSFFQSHNTTDDDTQNQPHEESPTSVGDPNNNLHEKELDLADTLVLNVCSNITITPGSDCNGNSEVHDGTAIDHSFELILADPTKWRRNDSDFITYFMKSKMDQNVKTLDFSKSKRSCNGAN